MTLAPYAAVMSEHPPLSIHVVTDDTRAIHHDPLQALHEALEKVRSTGRPVGLHLGDPDLSEEAAQRVQQTTPPHAWRALEREAPHLIVPP